MFFVVMELEPFRQGFFNRQGHTQTLTADRRVGRAAVIVTELTGMTSKNGKPYMATLADVQGCCGTRLARAY